MSGFEGSSVNFDGQFDDLAYHLFFAANVAEIVAAETGTCCLLVCWMVVAVACLGCKVAADLVITVMMGFAAAFDYCNLDSLLGCSYHERGEVLPLNEYCPLDPFDETFQDEVASYHRLKRFVAVVEDQYYTFHRACQDAPFVVNP